MYGNGGHLCDGYILGAIVPALPVFAQSHPISSLVSGLIGASALIGVFIGSLVFGWFTDKIGRRRMFVIDLALFVVLSLAQLAVTDAMMLLVLRILLGIAVGADYTIATTLVLPSSRPGNNAPRCSRSGRRCGPSATSRRSSSEQRSRRAATTRHGGGFWPPALFPRSCC